MNSIETLVSTYGYVAVFVGGLIEGETPVVLAGFLARRGYLSFGAVVLLVLSAAFCSDQLWFHVGRHGGTAILNRRPRWKASFQRVHALFDRHPVKAVLGFRYMYGFRIIAPVVIGTSGMSALRFLLLDFVGVTIWSTVIAGVGYFFGHVASALPGDVKRHEMLILAILALAGLLVWQTYRLRRRVLARRVSAAQTKKDLPCVHGVQP